MNGTPSQGQVIYGISAQGIIVQGPPARRSAKPQGFASALGAGLTVKEPPPAAEAEHAGDVRLGILMQTWPGSEQPFGALMPFARTVSGLARSEDVQVLVFSPEDVDLRRGRVRAHRWLGAQKGWTVSEADLPDVVWNRYFRRDQDRLVRSLQAEGIPFINEGCLNKWEAYQCLTMSEGTFREHLPRTELLIQASAVLELLEEYPAVFIKPISGSVGRGIIRAEREGPGLMRIQYVSKETDTVRETYASEAQLDRWLATKERAGRFVVQQGLGLTVFHGRPADVRVLVQKEGSGRWQVTGMGARVAGHGRFTANLHTGGQGVPVELLAEAIAPDHAARQLALIDQLEALALQAAPAIERSAGPMGEIGLDFGIDQRGQIWYIEQNGQPGRAIFEHTGRWDLSDLAHLRPVQYARHLASIKTVRAAGTQAT